MQDAFTVKWKVEQAHLTSLPDHLVDCNSLGDASRLRQMHVVFTSQMRTEMLVCYTVHL